MRKIRQLLIIVCFIQCCFLFLSTGSRLFSQENPKKNLRVKISDISRGARVKINDVVFLQYKIKNNTDKNKNLSISNNEYVRVHKRYITEEVLQKRGVPDFQQIQHFNDVKTSLRTEAWKGKIKSNSTNSYYLILHFSNGEPIFSKEGLYQFKISVNINGKWITSNIDEVSVNKDVGKLDKDLLVRYKDFLQDYLYSNSSISKDQCNKVKKLHGKLKTITINEIRYKSQLKHWLEYHMFICKWKNEEIPRKAVNISDQGLKLRQKVGRIASSMAVRKAQFQYFLHDDLKK